MNWEALKQKTIPFVDKAKAAGIKALDFTQKQMQSTPITIKNVAEFETLKAEKRLIIITYKESEPLAREILLRTPMWGAQAWTDAATLRFLVADQTPELVAHLGITTPVDMKVWYNGKKTYEANSFDSILAWWDTRCYTKSIDEASVAEGTNQTDPLATK